MTVVGEQDPAHLDLDDLLGDLAINHPDEYFRRLRDESPVYWNARWRGWIITGYADVTAGFRDHRRLSSDRFAGPFARDMTESKTQYAELIEFMGKWMFSNDRPHHTHLRSLVNAAFTPKSVDRLRPRIHDLVRALAEPLRGRDSVDFMTEFAFTLPVIVIAEYLGLPSESRHEVRALSEDLGSLIFVQGDTADRFANGDKAMNGLVELIGPVVRARKEQPRDDLISAMVHAEIDGARFTEEEVVSNAVLMVFAGHETTMNLLSNGVVAFERFPQEWDRLAADPALARSACEEILRLDGPIKALARWAKEPMELGGRHIAAGDRVLLVQHAANHDPAVFADPDSFDIGRRPNKHVAFGSGIHTCLGAPLSRLEAQETFAYLAQQFARIEVLTPELAYTPALVSRGLQGLHVRLHER